MSEPDKMASSGALGERFRIGRVAARSFAIWGRGLPVLLALALVVHAPRVASAEALGRLWQVSGQAYDWFLRLLFKQLVTTLVDDLFTGLSVAPVVFAVFARLRGRDVRVGESLRGGLRRFLPVLHVSLWLALLAAAPAFAAGISLVIYIRRVDPSSALPVLWVANIGTPLLVILLLSPFWVAVPAAVVETPARALRRSWGLTRGHRFAACAILVLLYGIRLGAGWTVTELASDGLAGHVLWWTVELIVVSLSAVCAAVGYHALRLEKDGVDVSDLERIFA